MRVAGSQVTRTANDQEGRQGRWRAGHRRSQSGDRRDPAVDAAIEQVEQPLHHGIWWPVNSWRFTRRATPGGSRQSSQHRLGRAVRGRRGGGGGGCVPQVRDRDGEVPAGCVCHDASEAQALGQPNDEPLQHEPPPVGGHAQLGQELLVSGMAAEQPHPPSSSTSRPVAPTRASARPSAGRR